MGKNFPDITKGHSTGIIFHHPEIGFTYLDKWLDSPNNTFYMLFTPDFEWDGSTKNFWNRHFYSVNDKRWFKLLRH
jgi:hypothetical protein